MAKRIPHVNVLTRFDAYNTKKAKKEAAKVKAKTLESGGDPCGRCGFPMILSPESQGSIMVRNCGQCGYRSKLTLPAPPKLTNQERRERERQAMKARNYQPTEELSPAK